jgi:hypothetical protein
MSEAPETIWATPDIYERVDWRFGEWAEQEPDTKTKRLYRRADLPPTTDQLLADPRVKALVDAVRHEREMVCQDFDMQLAASQAVDTALAQLKEPKE